MGAASEEGRSKPVVWFVVGLVLGIAAVLGYRAVRSGPEAKSTATSPIQATGPTNEPSGLHKIRLSQDVQKLIDGKTLFNDVKGMAFTQTDKVDLEGKNAGGAMCFASLVLEAAVGSNGISHNAVSAYQSPGYVVGRITNTSKDCKTNRYSFEPAHVYYWIAEIRSDNGKYKSRLVDLTDQANPVDLGKLHSKSFGFDPCGTYDQDHGDLAEMRYQDVGCHERRPGKPALNSVNANQADPSAVSQPATARGDSGARQGMGAGKGGTPRDGEFLTLWFSCDRTCCFADEGDS